MTVRTSADGAVEIVVTDDVASVCSGTPSTMTGTGRIEGSTRLVIRDWQMQSRLDPFTGRIRSLKSTETEALAQLLRYRKFAGPAARNLARLLPA